METISRMVGNYESSITAQRISDFQFKPSDNLDIFEKRAIY